MEQQISSDVLQEKYAKGNEKTELDIFRRVAIGVAAGEKTPALKKKWEEEFYLNMIEGAIGAGRIMSAAGTGITATSINCFVQPVGDSITDTDENGNPGIYEALKEAAETMRRGGGVGYNFSNIRPKNAFVKGTGSFASGPCSYMNVFDKSCETVESAGARRGAQMGVLNIEHPDIQDFIVAKRTPGRWNNFNVSVFVSNAFMEAKNNNRPWQLVHKAKPSTELIAKGAFQREDGLWVYDTIDASELWNTIMKSTYDFAEPGILFSDNINNDNNLRYVEKITATNPCGEQPLPAYGCCDLGPIILTKFVSNPFTPEATFKYESFEKAVAIQVRFLDNVLDTTHWPLEKQANEANNKRRIGVGFTGLGNCLAMLNLRYSSPEGITEARKIAVAMRDSAYTASVKLAKEKGKFPVFDADKYLEEGTFASRLPENIKELIRKHGIRNSHLLSIAPTGTVSLAFADNASNGIEPPFSLAYSRKKRNQDGTHTFYAVQDHSLRVFLSNLAYKNFADIILSNICEYIDSFSYKGKDYKVKDVLPKSIVTALELSVDEHMAMMAAIQPYIDTSISKTVNIPADYPFDDFKKVYDKAHNFHLKGISTYRPNNILGSVLSVGKPKEEEPIRDIFTEAEQFMNGRVEKRPNDSLDAINRKCEYYGPDGKIQFYISISFIKKSYPVDGVDVEIMRPIEVFVTVAPDDVPSEWINVFSRNLSLLARSDFKIFCKSLIDSKKIKSDKGKIRYGTYRKATGEVVPRFHSSDVALMAYAIQEILMDKNIVDETGVPNSVDELLKATKVVETTVEQATKVVQSNQVVPGKTCTECGAAAVIKRDGCTICTNCGHIGSCG